MVYVLWDFDETLAYREGDWAQSIFEVLQQEQMKNIEIKKIDSLLQSGFPWHNPDKHQSELFQGKAFWEYLQKLFIPIFQSFGLSEEKSKSLSLKVKDQYLDINKWHLYDDSLGALEKLKEIGYLQIIISNHIPELDKLVSDVGIDNYFVEIISSGITGYNKPNIKIFELTLKKIPINSKIVLIGDNYLSDIIGAQSAGIKCILVRSDNSYGYKYYQKDLKNIDKYIQYVLND
jgi:putative hydrolase of the HAD superfamily